jgi:tetratricopeptide (TPR) repeat protein
MAASVGASNALEMRLSELAAFGLGRPANVLFSEYVTVLVARGVIDAATAEQLSIGFYAARYGDPNSEDVGVRETIVRLEDVTSRLAAMPVDARLELSEQVQRDLRTISENVARSTITKVPIAADPAWEAPPLAAADGLWDAEPLANEFADEGPFLSVAVQPAESDSNSRRGRRLTLEIFAAVALFFAGYASYSPVEKFVQRNGKDVSPPRKDVSPEQAAREKPRVVESQPPKEALLRTWALADVRLQQDQKASLAYELLLALQPEDALTLNNLAWLYLTTKDPAVHNPQRGLELATHAITLRRSAEFLDTAAEAHFQTGNPQEAVTLEKEALEQTQENAPFQRGLGSILQRSLEKFEAACKPQPPSSSPPSHGPAPTKAPAGTSTGI